jgi:hypothetical protein
MGYSRSVCMSSYLQLNSTNKTLGCAVGLMSKLHYIGITPNSAYDKTYCGAPDSSPFNTSIYQMCSSSKYLKSDIFVQDFKDKCQNRTKCSLFMPKYIATGSGLAFD